CRRRCAIVAEPEPWPCPGSADCPADARCFEHNRRSTGARREATDGSGRGTAVARAERHEPSDRGAREPRYSSRSPSVFLLVTRGSMRAREGTRTLTPSGTGTSLRRVGQFRHSRAGTAYRLSPDAPGRLVPVPHTSNRQEYT